ncbi:MAG TPA: hypothetical protein VF192_08180 [Longimicrobiales bacterium]
MLGDHLGEEHGTISGTRVLPPDGGGPKVEASFQARGTILGVEITNIGTYVTVPKPGGFLLGTGRGIATTRDGETATWIGHGVGRHANGGATSWRGSLYYSTTSDRLDRLNGVVVVFEYDVDPDGHTTTRLWEWK